MTRFASLRAAARLTGTTALGVALASWPACVGAPSAPHAAAASTERGDGAARPPTPSAEAGAFTDASAEAVASDANASSLDASAAPTSAPYQEPPPVEVYRFHVYAKGVSRAGRTVVVESLVTTTGEADLAAGETALLERKVTPTPPDGNDWLPVADVVVKKLAARGRIELELGTEHPEAATKRRGKTPFAPGEKLRLQVDRRRESPR